jgi:Tat protein secretion system quality control protein TatD with DNase activity
LERVVRLHRSFMARPLVDAHCHLHDERLWSPISPSGRRKFEGVVARARRAQLTHVVCCATHEQDWRVLEELMEQQKEDVSLKIVPAFGVHPWWAPELSTATPDGLKPLRDLMTKYPVASVCTTSERTSA